MAMIEVERDGPIARVWLARPESHNALAPELCAELVGALGTLAADDAVRVLALGGRGPSFCAGADIATMKASANATFDENLAEAERLGAMFAALAGFPKPVVARVHGHVLGGGIGLVCACDIVVTSGTAIFGITEVRLGILPALISPYVLRRLGDRAARELMLTGERFDSDTAHRVGLVHHVVPDESLDAKVAERAHELLKGAPAAQRRIKLQLQRWAESRWDEYRATLPRVLAEVRAGAEAKDGLTAFLEKRKPGWFPDR
jgi:methylglutaconyl-CoA hydratase